MLNTKQYVLLGPQGSGKGTQAKILASKLDMPHIATGDIFRAAVESNIELGGKVKSLIDSGILVPDEITNQVVAERLKQNDATNGFVLDGFPRNLVQAEFLFNLCPNVRVIYLKLLDEEAVKRIGGRLTCTKCGTIYHKDFNPPPQVGLCVCGGSLEVRKDDTPEAIRARLNDYHKLTEPLLEFYRGNGLLVEIDGQLSISEVTANINEILGLV
ncbi:MAG: adenylate kinase [Patescibacteria group bacterium]